MNWRTVVAMLLVSMVLVACAAGANDMTGHANEAGEVAGFWLGLWHGMISPITWLISLFDPSVNLYEIHNNGGWYNFGFIMGVGGWVGGSGSSGSSAVSRARVRSYRRECQERDKQDSTE